jgi:hypothetical protein
MLVGNQCISGPPCNSGRTVSISKIYESDLKKEEITVQNGRAIISSEATIGQHFSESFNGSVWGNVGGESGRLQNIHCQGTQAPSNFLTRCR